MSSKGVTCFISGPGDVSMWKRVRLWMFYFTWQGSFAGVIKGMDLEVRRLSLVNHTDTVNHVSPKKGRNFPGWVRNMKWKGKEVRFEGLNLSSLALKVREGAMIRGMWWPLEVGNGPQFTGSKKARLQSSFHHRELNSASNPNEQGTDFPLKCPEEKYSLQIPGL